MRCPTLDELAAPPAGSSGWPWTAESRRASESSSGAPASPRISVVIAATNRAGFLEAAVRSALLQGYSDLELILVDIDRHPATAAVLKKYAPWTMTVTAPTDRHYHAIATGLAHTTGDVIGWLDPEDMYTSDSLRRVGSIFQESGGKVQWLTGMPCYWDIAGNIGKISTGLRPYRALLRRGWLDGITSEAVASAGTFWSRALWERAGARLNTALSAAADFDLWNRFAQHQDLYITNIPLAGVRLRIDRTSAQTQPSYWKEIDASRKARRVGLASTPLLRGIERRLIQMSARAMPHSLRRA